MLYTKNGLEYRIDELAKEWKIEREDGKLRVIFRVSKSDAPDEEALRRYIAENDAL